jgi:hypothetical protein
MFLPAETITLSYPQCSLGRTGGNMAGTPLARRISFAFRPAILARLPVKSILKITADLFSLRYAVL